MSDWTERFRVITECRDCGAQFEHLEPTTSVDRVDGFSRLVMFGAGENCPECRNLKEVKGQ